MPTHDSSAAPRSGELYIVATPIGNLSDLSRRALETLSGADVIACEDTRVTRPLLAAHGIAAKTVALHAHNERTGSAKLLEALTAGQKVALVSDAGTPGISDPADRVIRAARDRKIPVVAIPGAAAFLPALVVSGLPIDRFVFEGFLPVKKGRKTKLAHMALEERTMVLYESPHRILRTLADLRTVLGEREVSVSRELTKKFEEVVRGTLTEAHRFFSSKTIKGEFVVVVAGTSGPHAEEPET
jgi:16S rRNA (cytidine1402-2'-O)-methyltransferase